MTSTKPRVRSSSGLETGHRIQLVQRTKHTARGGVSDRAAKRHTGPMSIMVPFHQEAFQVPWSLLSACAQD